MSDGEHVWAAAGRHGEAVVRLPAAAKEDMLWMVDLGFRVTVPAPGNTEAVAKARDAVRNDAAILRTLWARVVHMADGHPEEDRPRD